MIPKITYCEKYKNPGIQIKKEGLPVLNHVTKGFKCIDGYLMEAGHLEDGKEYQIIRVIVTEDK